MELGLLQAVKVEIPQVPRTKKNCAEGTGAQLLRKSIRVICYALDGGLITSPHAAGASVSRVRPPAVLTTHA